MHSQQGSGVLIMVIILLVMGTALLHATRRQLSDNLSLVMDEKEAIQQYTRAVSALSWGERLQWRETENGYCQQQPLYHWRSCLKNQASGLLLRGDSGDGTFALYRWVTHLSNGQPQALPHGWLDYCPLADRKLCDVE